MFIARAGTAISMGDDDEPPLDGRHAVLLFDGVCLLCNFFVHFVIERDPAARFKFATLQGATGVRLLRRHGLAEDLSTVVLFDADGAHTRSTAALRVLRHCTFPWCLFYVLIVVPPALRNCCYDTVARTRYRLFGKDEEAVCRRPTPALRERLLN